MYPHITTTRLSLSHDCLSSFPITDFIPWLFIKFSYNWFHCMTVLWPMLVHVTITRQSNRMLYSLIHTIDRTHYMYTRVTSFFGSNIVYYNGHLKVCLFYCIFSVHEQWPSIPAQIINTKWLSILNITGVTKHTIFLNKRLYVYNYVSRVWSI